MEFAPVCYIITKNDGGCDKKLTLLSRDNLIDFNSDDYQEELLLEKKPFVKSYENYLLEWAEKPCYLSNAMSLMDLAMHTGKASIESDSDIGKLGVKKLTAVEVQSPWKTGIPFDSVNNGVLLAVGYEGLNSEKKRARSIALVMQNDGSYVVLVGCEVHTSSPYFIECLRCRRLASTMSGDVFVDALRFI
uniref:p22 n=1 Tax=Grapevine leafroll-associated virus 1 TaxID=47985 RepID=Q9Q6P6_9CLOS|nr:p22 [Grapevine leafroll-associated virus 1]